MELTRMEKSSIAQEFLNSITEVYKKYGLSLSHEDGHGSFIVEQYSEENVEWLLDAYEIEADGTYRGIAV